MVEKKISPFQKLFDFPIMGGDGRTKETAIIFHKTISNFVELEYFIVNYIMQQRNCDYKIVSQCLSTHKDKRYDQIIVKIMDSKLDDESFESFFSFFHSIFKCGKF